MLKFKLRKLSTRKYKS